MVVALAISVAVKFPFSYTAASARHTAGILASIEAESEYMREGG